MDHCGLSKDDKDALFESLHVLKRLSEDCFASDATDSRICHHHSDAQTGETTPSRVRQQSAHHGATADAIPDETIKDVACSTIVECTRDGTCRPNGKII